MENRSSELDHWLKSKKKPEWLIYIKRLSGNDTGATGGHQAGPYIPKKFIFRLFPGIDRKDKLNPSHKLPAASASHMDEEREVRAIYYNNSFFDRGQNASRGRDEARITGWGGKTGGSPLQDPENTGSLAIFTFLSTNQRQNSTRIDAWVSRSIEEEEQIESIVGEVIPGETLFGSGDKLLGGFTTPIASLTNKDYAFPEEWKTIFPSGMAIIDHLINSIPNSIDDPDKLILKRRETEFALFRKIEEAHVLSKVQKGFENIDDFMNLANSVSNRRKSRSGKSLEIHLERIFKSKGLHNFEEQCITENRKKPDFIFPSCSSYHTPNYPSHKLRMLAVKTTCKDRWRQIINEANRVKKIHLFTLQEGVSESQFREMQMEGVSLVVPKPLHKSYPEAIRPELITLDNFINEMKELHP